MIKVNDQEVNKTPLLTVSGPDVDDRGSHGLEVVQVEVVMVAGKVARFWVTAYVNDQGQAVLEVATNKTVAGEVKTVKKGVTATRLVEPRG